MIDPVTLAAAQMLGGFVLLIAALIVTVILIDGFKHRR